MDKHIFLPESKVLTSKEDEAVVILGATQKKVGAGSSSWAGVVSSFFFDAVEDWGRKLVTDKVEKDN